MSYFPLPISCEAEADGKDKISWEEICTPVIRP